MICQRILQGFSFLAIGISSCAAVFAQSEAQDEATTDVEIESKIDALIEQLGDQSFKVRQAAGEKIAEFGTVAEKQLTKQLSSNDVEIRSRCLALLQVIDHQLIVARRIAFIEGDVEQLKQNVKSWKRFEKIVGNDVETRKLFIDIQLGYPKLIKALEQGEPCTKLIDQLCIETTPTIGIEIERTSRAFVAAIAFAGIHDSLEPIAVCRGTGAFHRYGDAHGRDDPALRKLLGAWVAGAPAHITSGRLLRVGEAYELPEVTRLARDMLVETKMSPTIPIRILAAQGTAEDIAIIDPWIWNENAQKKSVIAKTNVTRSLSDSALATCVKLSGLNLEDFGFVTPKGLDNSIYSHGFENDLRREAAREQWKTFRDRERN